MLIRHFVIYETFTEVFILVVPSPALTVYMTFWTIKLLRKQLIRMNQFLWIRRFALPLKEFFLKKILFSLFLGISNSLCQVCKGPLSINMPTGLFDKSDHFVGWHFQMKKCACVGDYCEHPVPCTSRTASTVWRNSTTKSLECRQNVFI